MPTPEATELDDLLAIRHKWRERFEMQLEAAMRSYDRGHHALARAELRGAMLILEDAEKRDGR